MSAQIKDTATNLFGDTLRVRIVRLFVMHEGKEFSMQDVIAKIKGSRAQVTSELAALVRGRVLSSRAVKNVYVWKLVPGPHTASLPHLFQASMQKEDEKRVEKLLKAGRLVFAAIGGKLMGDEFAPLDMLIVGTMKEVHLVRVLKGYEAAFGREIQYMVVSEKEFVHRMDVRDRLLYTFFEHTHEIWYNKSKATLPL
jgi:hypothetical protein